MHSQHSPQHNNNQMSIYLAHICLHSREICTQVLIWLHFVYCLLFFVSFSRVSLLFFVVATFFSLSIGWLVCKQCVCAREYPLSAIMFGYFNKYMLFFGRAFFSRAKWCMVFSIQRSMAFFLPLLSSRNEWRTLKRRRIKAIIWTENKCNHLCIFFGNKCKTFVKLFFFFPKIFALYILGISRVAGHKSDWIIPVECKTWSV